MNVAWFVSAKEQVFGPYSHELMRDFVAQKRVGQRSLVRLGETGEFMPAGMHAALTRMFEVADPASGSTHNEPTKHGHAVPASQSIADDLASNYVVVVDLRTGSHIKFETEIRKLGKVFRLNHLVLLLQSDRSASAIKSSLLPFVGTEDPLLIIDAGRNRMAWHNFGVFEASAVRDLWKMPHERV
jgi:hypothetical protein